MDTIKQLIIVSGMSGAGKTATLKVLEDLGFYAIDNIPPGLLPQLLHLLENNKAVQNFGVVATVDVRSSDSLNALPTVISEVKRSINRVRLIFLDASDDILVQRFGSTRRRHPLGDNLSTLEGIRIERKLLEPILELADIVIDTSHIDLNQHRQRVLDEFKKDVSRGASLIISSFGFKYGVPSDANYVFDVRFLTNPFYIPNLKPLSGVDRPVQDYLMSLDDTEEFLNRCFNLLDFVIQKQLMSGKAQVHIAIGCTGGRHRSVAIAEWIGEHYKTLEGGVTVTHRDKGRV